MVARPPQDSPGEYVLEDQIGHLLRRAHQRASAIFMDMMAAHQLTPTQFAALAKIREHGTVSQNELGRMTAMDPATMQGVMQRLFDRALIERRPHPGDRRRVSLSLSPAGQALVDGALADAHATTSATLAPLSEPDRREFLRLLEKLAWADGEKSG